MAAEEPVDGQQIDYRQEDLAALGQALGLHPAFIRDVALRGQEAIIDRIAATDKTGAQTRALALAQMYGQHFEERIIAGEPPEAEEVPRIIEDFARMADVHPAHAAALLGAVQDVYQLAVRFISERGRENATPQQMGAVGTGPA